MGSSLSSPITQAAPRSGQLDGPPPLPGAVQAVAGAGAPSAPGAQSQAMIIQRAMLAEKVLQSMVPMMPGLGPLMDNISQQLRQGILQIFQAQQSGAGQGPGSPMPSSGGAPVGGSPVPGGGQ